MKKILLLMLLCGCASKQENQKLEEAASEHSTDRMGSQEVADNFSSLADYFKPVSFDTLYIYSEYKEEESMLAGKSIPNSFLAYFPEEVRLGATEWNVGDVYAVYRFAYSPDVTALIARVPSEHSSTAYSIFLFSSKSNKLLHSQRIAEFTGSGGDAIEEESWLIDLNNDSLMDIVTKKRETFVLDEDITEFAHYDSAFVFIGTPKGFKRSQEYSDRIKNFIIKARKQSF